VSITVVLSDDGTPPRLAFAIGKRVGTAVERNRLRRRLRAIFRELPVPSGAYLLAAGPEAATLPTAQLRSHVRQAIDAAIVRS
jgi:ribonuclease P protein component